MLRNIADRPESIDMVFQEIGSEQLLNSLSQALESDNDDVRSQVSPVFVSIKTPLYILKCQFFSGRIPARKPREQQRPPVGHPSAPPDPRLPPRMPRRRQGGGAPPRRRVCL